jgi:uncharacterized protein (DUF1800 family)
MMTPSTTTHWPRYEPTAAAPWNLQRVVHLHRRAAFAAPWKTLQRDLTDGPRPSIDRLLAGEADGGMAATEFEPLARSIGDAAAASENPSRLKAWWLYRMLMSPDPLAERLTLMWHNHFATSNRKVQDLHQMRGQNELFRRHAQGPFAEMLAAVVKHPATLIWLDADSNRSGHPNENLARELMELFTLGIGNYSETDVKEAARALTGWSVSEGQFQFKKTRHDAGDKNLFGINSPMTGDDLIRKLVENPSTARRLAWRICQTFLGEGTVDDKSLEELAAGLRERQLHVGWAVETILRSQRFFADDNLRMRIVSPVEYVIGTIRALELRDQPPSTLTLAEWTARMGQELFYPPNVGGWNEGRAWLTSRSIVARANFATALVEGRLWRPEQRPSLQELPQRHAVDPGSVDKRPLEDSVAWFARLLWGDAPEPVLRDVVQAAESTKSGQPLAVAIALLLARPENHLG